MITRQYCLYKWNNEKYYELGLLRFIYVTLVDKLIKCLSEWLMIFKNVKVFYIKKWYTEYILNVLLWLDVLNKNNVQYDLYI